MIEKKKKWKLADFDYPLPEKYIAQYPAKRRDLSKLMVIHRETGKIEHKIFSSLPEYLRRNDLVILNNTKVFPARLYASKDRTDAKVEVFCLMLRRYTKQKQKECRVFYSLQLHE